MNAVRRTKLIQVYQSLEKSLIFFFFITISDRTRWIASQLQHNLIFVNTMILVKQNNMCDW